MPLAIRQRPRARGRALVETVETVNNCKHERLREMTSFDLDGKLVDLTVCTSCRKAIDTDGNAKVIGLVGGPVVVDLNG